jgi:hypothetical protein
MTAVYGHPEEDAPANELTVSSSPLSSQGGSPLAQICHPEEHFGKLSVNSASQRMTAVYGHPEENAPANELTASSSPLSS